MFCMDRVYSKETEKLDTLFHFNNKRNGVETMNIGYVRVSTEQQNTMRQEVLMEQYGVETLYIDKVSGKNTDRPQLKKMMDFVREGDCVIVESISRFARSTKDLLDLLEKLSDKKVKFVSQKENIDTDSPMGKFFLVVCGALAELERANILERQAEGIEIAKREGKYKGRKPIEIADFDKIYQSWKAGEITAVSACKLMGISRSTFYRKVGEKEKNET